MQVLVLAVIAALWYGDTGVASAIDIVGVALEKEQGPQSDV